jgi:hypothetical protein
MSCAIYLTTTITAPNPVPIIDLGRIPGFAHPTIDYDLLQEFTTAQLQKSVSLQDAITAGYITLKDCYGNSITDVNQQFAPVTSENHEAIRQLIHFIDDGPTTGDTLRRETTGTVFPTAIVWYHTVDVTEVKLVEKLITWTGVNPTTIVWKLYDDSETLLVTITDTISYTDVFETGRTRVIT